MQVDEQIAGAFLLQEMEPKALHGVVTAVVAGADAGWLLLSALPGPVFSYDVSTERLSLQMALDVAVRFAGTLILLASISHSELREDRSAEIGELQVVGRPGRKVLEWSSVQGSPDVRAVVQEGGLEVRLRAALALALAFRILREAGRISAHP